MKKNVLFHKSLWMVMRITLYQVLLAGLFAGLAAAHDSRAQRILNQSVTLSETHARLGSVLEKIEKSAGVKFVYSTKINAGERVSLQTVDRPLSEVLQLLLTPLQIRYEVLDSRILLRKRAPSGITVAEHPVPPMAENQEISGKVTDEKGEGLPGVSVLVKGTQQGTVTGASGDFRLNIAGPESVLVFSFVGYMTQEITAGNVSDLQVMLQVDEKALEEVLVVGYGTQKKVDITGSVSAVDVRALKSIPTGSALQALQGQAAGVNVISSGVPGGNSTVFIRGITSFGSTGPLVLIDGVPGSINDLRSDEVESMQVLKDAGAAAIYGVRGANGVIVVTTKKGKSGQPVVTYDAFYGQQFPLKKNPFNLLNSEDFARLTLIANPASNIFKNGMPDYLYAGPGVVGAVKEGDPGADPSKYVFDQSNTPSNYLIQSVNKQGTDWFREVFKRAPMTNHNLAISGGTAKSSYMVSLGYFDQTGTLLNTYLRRYSMRINTDFKVRNHLRVGQNIYGYYRQNNGLDNLAVGNSVSHIYRMMPIVPVYDIMGNFGGSFAGPELGSGENPVSRQKRTENNRNNTWNLMGNVYAEADLLKDLTLRTSFGGTISSNYAVNFTFNSYNDAFFNNRENALSEGSGYGNSMIWTNTLRYGKKLGRHQLQVLLGTEALKSSGRSVSGSSNSLYATDFDYLVLGNGTKNFATGSSAYAEALFSTFGRLDYSFNEKYLLGVTVRRDGSSRFGSENRFGTFPSVSAGWRLSDEAFLKGVAWINDLKLKASYGILGSQNNINPENAYSLFGSTMTNSYYDLAGSSTGLTQGFFQSRNGNPRTGWERNVVTNIGLDALLFNNRLEAGVEYYNKSIEGLLFPEPLPATAGGAEPPTINIGDIRNRGVDISLLYRDRIGESLRYNIGVNVTTYRNEVVHIPDPGYFESAGGGSIIGTLIRNQVGHPVSSFYGYEVIGLFSSDRDVAESPVQNEAAPGRFKYRDANGDGKISTDDRVFFGNPNPDFTYGLNAGLEFRQFDFSAVFYGSQGNDLLNHVRYFTDFFSNPGGKSNVLLNAWTPENTNTKVPKVETVSSFSTSGVANSYYREDGSYLRLKSLLLGYQFTPEAIRKIGLSKLRVYLQAANLFTVTRYTGLDPEISGSSASFGADFGNYPGNQKSFLLGLNLAF